MTRNILARFITSFAAPSLTACGFEKRGLTFRRRETAAWSIVTFIGEAVDRANSIRFYPQAGVYVPQVRPWLSPQLQQELDSRVPGIEHTQLTVYLRASRIANGERSTNPAVVGQWAIYDEDDEAPIGAELSAILRQQLLPFLADASLAGGGKIPPLGSNLYLESVRKPFTNVGP